MVEAVLILDHSKPVICGVNRGIEKELVLDCLMSVPEDVLVHLDWELYIGCWARAPSR